VCEQKPISEVGGEGGEGAGGSECRGGCPPIVLGADFAASAYTGQFAPRDATTVDGERIEGWRTGGLADCG